MFRKATYFVGIWWPVSLTSSVGDETTSNSRIIYRSWLLAKYESMSDVWSFCSSQTIVSWIMTPCLKIVKCFQITVTPFQIFPFFVHFSKQVIHSDSYISNSSSSKSLIYTWISWTLFFCDLHVQESHLLRRYQVAYFSNVECGRWNNE